MLERTNTVPPGNGVVGTEFKNDFSVRQFANATTCLRIGIVLVTLALLSTSSFAQDFTFKYRPSPANNPARGLVPYASAMPWCDPDLSADEKAEYLKKYAAEVFPHSIEFHYFSMRELMPEKGSVDFSPIEKWLYQANMRGCQLTFRIYLEYPTHKTPDVPQFLIDNGLQITKWKNKDRQLIHAPDYNNQQLRESIDFLIQELGAKYDGDPRVACLTMGMLGHWGEWHSYPRNDLFPDKQYQAHLMDQFAKAFKKTPVLMRYPANDENENYASNANMPFGFHDDSFAWATIETGKQEDDWFFLASMKAAGTLDAWKTRMIGGEIRPEIWGCIFDDPPCEVAGQEFNRCIEATHVSWLMDSGMFGEKGIPSKERIRNAKQRIAKLGYEFFASTASVASTDNETCVRIQIENRGVAPIYFDWPVEFAILDSNGNIRKAVSETRDLPNIMPGEAEVWKTTIKSAMKAGDTVAMRITNPMPGGFRLRFANETQQLDGEGWLLLK